MLPWNIDPNTTQPTRAGTITLLDLIVYIPHPYVLENFGSSIGAFSAVRPSRVVADENIERNKEIAPPFRFVLHGNRSFFFRR